LEHQEAAQNASGSERAAVPDGEPQAGRSKKSTLRRFAGVIGYILFLVCVVGGVLYGLEYYAYLQIKKSPLGQAYSDKDMDLARRSTQVVSPLYGYEPTPGFAAVRNTRLGNAYEYINEQSFKDFEAVPLEKPAEEYRVFVTGGSVVFGRGPVPPADTIADGYEVTYRWTIPHIMEKLLNADPRVRDAISGKEVRVINAGVAGYVIQNDLMRYLAKLRLYDPDLIVSLDGANEVHTVARPLKDWNYFTQGQYYEIISEIIDMSPGGILNYLGLWLKRNTYLFTWLAVRKGRNPGVLRENVGFAAHPQDATPEMLELRDRNIDQVADVLALYHAALETDGVPHVLAIQPMLRNCKKPRTPLEVEIERVTGMEKIGFYNAKETYDRLVERIKERADRSGFDVADLTDVFDNVESWVFTDWCHLTNGANYIVAKKLANEVKTEVFGLELLPGDRLEPPLDDYFRDYAKKAAVLVGDEAVDSGIRILKGYPGEEVFEAGKPDLGPAEHVVLDLGDPVPLSRFRIVWADSSAVPEGFRIEISKDREAWQDWFAVSDVQPDSFDQWPGFEYYSVERHTGRYVRYTPTGPGQPGPIRLRQISLYK
jgi:hypothetical protein